MIKNPLIQLAMLRSYAKSIGWMAAVSLRFYDLRNRLRLSTPRLTNFKLKNATHPIQMRTGRSSDRAVLGQIFIGKEYEPIMLSSPQMIVDLRALRRGRDGREWTTQVEPAGKTADGCDDIDGYDMGTLIDLSGADEIDLLKIDIERSELEIFQRNTDNWLPRVRNLCIELHGEDCETTFFRALSGYSYDLSRSGELTVCRNLQMGR